MRSSDEIIKDLRTRAAIRRKLDRGHGKSDRIADQLDEAAARIEELERNIKDLYGELGFERSLNRA